ncbi:MAG: polysaccharide deacetylase family protein [Clostridia bacterium]|nr:polysaccharide deacetylase family protein [Clostridia bacterium]
MKKRIILLFAVILLLFSSCSNNAENETTTGFDTGTTVSEEFTDEYTTIPDAEGLEENSSNSAETIVNQNSSIRIEYGERTGTELTATGLEPLEKKNFILEDMNNSVGKSNEMISHSYGVASDEIPHSISIQNQKFFDEKNYDAVCYDSKTDDKVLYLTFDCGYENGYTAKILDVLKDKDVPAAFFCTLPQMRDNHEIIARMINEGHVVGNHSVTHPDFSSISRSQIIDELKGFDDYIRENFGYSALYFRYPQGKYSENALDAVNSLGFKCVFWSLAYADWDLEDQKGAAYAYETVMSRIHPGAVILLHAVSPDNANALGRIIDAAREKGYEFRSLEDI